MAVERKKFFEIEVPIMGKTVRLYGKSLKEFDKRVIKIDLTRSLRGKSLEATMVVKVDGTKAIAESKRVVLLPSFIRRMVRDAISYVEDSFEAECLDGILRVKIFLITRKKVPRSVRKALRDAAKIYILEELKEKTREEAITDVMNNRMQKPLSLKLKKIYPLSLCEIKELRVEKIFEGKIIERKPKVEAKDMMIDQVAELEGETLDQAGELETQKEGLDQMKEVEEALAKRAEGMKKTDAAEETPEKKEASSEDEEKAGKKAPKKKAVKKKKEE